MAKDPDVVVKSFDFAGPGAEEIAQFLALDQPPRDGSKDRLYFTPPQDYDRRASAKFFEGNRPGNFLTPTYNVIRWDRIGRRLLVSGFWLDHATGPHMTDRLRYEFPAPLGKSPPAAGGPAASPEAVGWNVLIDRLGGEQKSPGRGSRRKSFKVRPVAPSEARWWDRLASRMPWATKTLEFRVDFDDKGQAEYAGISIGP